MHLYTARRVHRARLIVVVLVSLSIGYAAGLWSSIPLYADEDELQREMAAMLDTCIHVERACESELDEVRAASSKPSYLTHSGVSENFTWAEPFSSVMREAAP